MKKTLAKVATLYLLEQAGSVGDSKGPLFLPAEKIAPRVESRHLEGNKGGEFTKISH